MPVSPTVRLEPAPTRLETVLTPEWLGTALGSPSDPVAVLGVEVVETITTMATKCRFTTSHGDGAPDGPSGTWCVKGFFEPTELGSIARLNGQAEVLFYRDIAPTTTLSTPFVRYTGIDARSGHGLLLMGDVTARGGRFLTALDHFTPDQARQSVSQLAALHAGSWDSTSGATRPWLRNRLAEFVRTEYLPVDAIQALLDDGRADPLPVEVRRADRLVAALPALLGVSVRAPQCVVHGDAHAGNLYVLDGAVSLVDWQLVQRAHWALDVAYHVTTVLTTEDRRLHERALLDHYLDELAARGVAGVPDREEAWTAYRAHVLYGYFLWAITRKVAREITVRLARRLGQAVADLGSYGLVER